jgi:hypothetical protein
LKVRLHGGELNASFDCKPIRSGDHFGARRHATDLTIALAQGTMAQTGNAEPPNVSVLPYPDPQFKGVIGRTTADSKPDFPQPVKAPEGAPNIVVILTDDVGFGYQLHHGRRRAAEWPLYRCLGPPGRKVAGGIRACDAIKMFPAGSANRGNSSRRTRQAPPASALASSNNLRRSPGSAIR